MTRSKKAQWRSCRSKLRYDSEHDALRVAKQATNMRGTPLTCYYCNECHGYHLTRRIE